MNAAERYFHGRYAAARAYVLGKAVLGMVALDTWLLMIGHAGRYGVDGFNVAHFRFLDAIAPLPSAGSYIAVLVLSGLLALSLALAGTHPLPNLALFLLYTFSWSMSMLDSYQHHYFVSSILLCLVFFPRVRAADVHPPLPAPSTEPRKKGKKKHERAASAAAQAETSSGVYVAVCGAALLAYALLPAGEHPWLLFVASCAVVAIATFVYQGPRRASPMLTSGFGFNLLGVTIAILYTYTSVAKMDAEWCGGHTIQRISSAAEVFAPLVDWLSALGLPRERFWSLFSTSVIPLELAIACGYLLALRQDESENPWLRRASTGAFVLAMTLHVGAEAMRLEIGWFSYYMMLFACVFLLPGRVVDRLATLLTWPARMLEKQLDFGSAGPASAAQSLSMAFGTALVLGAVGYMLDLPGALAACLIAAAAVVLMAIAAVLQKPSDARLLPALLGVGTAGALMWAAIAASDVRYDFYRYLGGDLRRRGQPEAALAAYERGERYAPEGQSRKTKIDELRKQLGKE